MERAVVIGAAIVILAVVGTLGAGVGLVLLMGDPANQVQRECSAGQMGPPGGCKNFVITGRTRDRVDYAYDLADGTHCQGYQQVDRRGFLGLPMGGEGGTTCASPPIATSGPAPTTVSPDGNPSCSNMSLAGPTATEHGFQIVATNTGAGPCDISHMAKVAFLDTAGNVINIDFQVRSASTAAIALQPGASAVYDFEVGPGRCQTAAVMLFVNEAGSRQLGAPASVCPPVVENPAKLAA